MQHAMQRFIFSTSRLLVLRSSVQCHWPWKRAGSRRGPKARRTGFLARMLPCEKSVGGIPTRQTLSLQPWRPRRRESYSKEMNSQASRRGVDGLSLSPSSSSSSFCSSSSLLASSFDDGRTRRPGETIVSEERVRRSEKHESLRTTDGLRANEWNAGTRLSRAGCSPAANMWIYFIQPFPSGAGLNYSRRGVAADDALLVVIESSSHFRSIKKNQSCKSASWFREKEMFYYINRYWCDLSIK